MNPIFNVIDNWECYTIEFKDETIKESNRKGWRTFYINKKHIKRSLVN